jgi:hypothetical protein
MEGASMKKHAIMLGAILLFGAVIGFAADVEMKTSGPSGQGTIIWYAPKTGITNLVMTTNGVTYLYIEGGAILNSTSITNVLAEGMVLPAVDASAVTNLSAGQLKAGTVLLAVSGLAVTNINAANIKAGTVASAFSGLAVTNLDAANVKVGSVASAFSGAAITNLTAANVATVGGANAITNLILLSDGTTNSLIYFPFGGGYVLKSSTPL